MNEQEEFAVLSKAAYDWYHGDHDLAKEELEAYGLPYRLDTDHSDEFSDDCETRRECSFVV